MQDVEGGHVRGERREMKAMKKMEKFPEEAIVQSGEQRQTNKEVLRITSGERSSIILRRRPSNRCFQHGEEFQMY